MMFAAMSSMSELSSSSVFTNFDVLLLMKDFDVGFDASTND
jgi:hypothetical protein